ncbi:MAG: HD domain-containing phosphohydrolase [Chlorobiaceae bacterium]
MVELRRRAEERLKSKGVIPDILCSKEAMQHVLQELSIHQIELEMQKEELLDSRDNIQKEQRRYADLYDFAPVGYLTLAADSTILEANLTIARILSVDRSRLKGIRFESLIAQRDRPAFNSMMKRALLSRTEEYSEIMIGKAGTANEPASLQRIFQLDAIISDSLPEYHLTLTDISDARRTLEAFKSKEAQYRRLFEAAREGILILDYKSGTVIDANPFIAHLLGFSLDEITGKKVWELGFVVDDMKARKAYLKLQSKGFMSFSDISLQHKNGEFVSVELVSSVYKVGDEHAIQCNIRDISNQKKLSLYEKSISTSHQETIYALASMVEIRDSFAAGHQKRVAELSVAIAEELRLSPGEISGLQLSSILHDIGKVTIPTELLVKTTPLTEAEMEMLRTHSQAGYDVLKGIHFPWPIAQTVLQHHERLDGSGYPNRLKSESIRKEARIIGVADTVEAMSGARPYRPAVAIDKVLRHIRHESGRLFDPGIVEICVGLFQDGKFRFSM